MNPVPAATACCAALLLCCVARAADGERRWPEFTLPADAQAWTSAGRFSANGVPLRVSAFLSARPIDEVERDMRRKLGEPLVHSRLGGRRVLGRAEAGFYLSVQLEPAAGGTRALLAVADLQAAQAQRAATQARAQRWLQRLPAGTQLLSHSGAHDAAQPSAQLVYRNGASAELNSQALKHLLEQDGLSLEREQRATSPGERVLLFKGLGGEASAVVVRLPDGQSAVVLNTVGSVGPEARP